MKFKVGDVVVNRLSNISYVITAIEISDQGFYRYFGEDDEGRFFCYGNTLRPLNKLERALR